MKKTLSFRDTGGFTLIEVMVAMLISLVGLVGLLQAVNLAMEHNLKNQLRDEATLLAEQAMGNLKVRGFSQISSTFSPRQVPSRLRGGGLMYTLDRSGIAMGPSAVQLVVRVGWRQKSASFTHEVRSVRVDQ
jgi:type IV pilus assembly protein PilV